MKRGAFTLVELLVVMALLAVLSVLALGTVSRARERADAVLCSSNLRQLAGANLGYAGEHDGSYVPAQDMTNLVRWHGVRKGLNTKFDAEKGPLAAYLGREGRVKLCPALRHVLTGQDTFEDGTGGFGYNAAYIGGIVGDPFTPARMANVPSPARTVMFTDAAFARGSGLQEYPYTEPWKTEVVLGKFRGSLYASVHFRHEGRANVAWCDGHVTTEEPSQIDGTNSYGGNAAKWSLGWFGPSAQNGYWRP